MKKIEKREINNCSVSIPGSKSISHRMVILAALSEGESIISNVLKSEDLMLTIDCLKSMGSDIIEIDKGTRTYRVQGLNGSLKPYHKDIYLGNSGTSMRLLTGIAGLGKTDFILNGDKRMQERPMTPLLNALNMAGIKAESINKSGNPPVKINGINKNGGKVSIDCSLSSQYLSSLLMIGCYMPVGIEIELLGEPVSAPYIDLTVSCMDMFGVKVDKVDSMHYKVTADQKYIAGSFKVEPDLSNSGYFWSAGAISQKKVKVLNVSENSLQGDLELAFILKKMGCDLEIEDDGISICGRDLHGIEVDMGHTPDAVPALAVTAAFAKGETFIKNIGHLREKECDRINAVATELSRMGVKVDTGSDWMRVYGGKPVGAQIQTYNDHRIAMAFSIAGLVTEDVYIENEHCVAKSFPDFWKVFERI